MTEFHPTDLWSFVTADGRHVRAMFFPRGLQVTLAWFVNDKPAGAEDFAEWEDAMDRANQLREEFERQP